MIIKSIMIKLDSPKKTTTKEWETQAVQIINLLTSKGYNIRVICANTSEGA